VSIELYGKYHGIDHTRRDDDDDVGRTIYYILCMYVYMLFISVYNKAMVPIHKTAVHISPILLSCSYPLYSV